MSREVAVGIIGNEEGILTIYRHEHGHYELPGGKIRDHEDPAAAFGAKRREELGVRVSTMPPVYDPITVQKPSGERATVHLVRARVEAGVPARREAIHGDIRYMGLFALRHHMRERQLSPALARFARLVIDGEVRIMPPDEPADVRPARSG